MAPVRFILEMHCLCFPLRIILLFLYAVPACGFTVVAEGSSATERTTDISLRCRAGGLTSDDEVVRVTWFSIDKSQRFLSEIFSADLTNDRPAFLFSSDWAGRGLYDTSTMANVRLPSRFVNRDFAGNYRCQVDSLMSSGFSDVKVNVLYGPGASIIISPGGRVERREGEQLSLSCIAQCNPGCSYRWYKAGRLVSSSGTLTMTSLTRDQAGLYACQARNEAGRSIKPVDLRVSFPASVLNLNINSEDLETSRSRTSEAYEGTGVSKTVVFTCKVAAWPEPNIEWSKSNTYNDAANKTRVISTAEVDLELKSSVFEIKTATCRDNGNYTCKAWNSVGDPSFKTSILNMSCAPFETKHSSNCSRGQEITIIKHINTNLHINLCFFGNPVPTVTMIHLNTKNEVMTTRVGNTSCDFKMNHCNSVFDFNITSPEQYGEYIVKVINGHGYFEKRYVVSSQQPPLLPSMLSVSNISNTSACLSWDSNFNGGARQTFSLKVYSTSHQQNREQKRDFSVEEDDRTKIDTRLLKYSLCVSSLHPSTQYEVILSASNRFGEADSSRRISFATFTSLNSTIPILSWLSVVQTTTSGYSGERTTISPEERIGRLMFEEQPTEEPQTFRNDALNVLAAEAEQDKEDSEVNVLGFDGERGKQFFRLLDAYFTLDKLTDDAGFKTWLKQNPGISNLSSNLEGLFLHYARTQDEGFRIVSTSYPNTTSGLDNETTSSIIFSTPVGEPAASSASLSPVLLSVIFIGIICIFGVIISFICISVLKRQQMRSHYNKKYSHRDVQRPSRKKPTSVNRNPSQTQSIDQRNIQGVLVQRVPSITCVYNANAFFTPPATRRPRLSTPDVNLLRQKETSNAPETQEGYSLGDIDAHPGRLPFITVDNTHGSCMSYLELVQSETEPSLQNYQLSETLQDDHVFVNTQQQQQQHLRPASQRFSYSSLQQTYVKSLSDDETDVSSSYLDLYETLAVRSRSRSPSNIYNPLFFDATSINSSTGASEHAQSNNAYARDRTMMAGNTDSLNTAISSSTQAVNNTNQSAINTTIQTHSDCVQCRPKKTPLRQKLTRAPSGPEGTTGMASESSYELVNVSSRKRLSSYMYFPMISKMNVECAFPGNTKLTNYEPSDIDDTYEKPKCGSGFQSRRIPQQTTRSEANAYDSRIPTETIKHDSEILPDAYSYVPSHYQHYIDIDELSRRRNVSSRECIPQRGPTITYIRRTDSDDSIDDNRKLKYQSRYTCNPPNDNNKESIYEADNYVEDDTISYTNRDSVSTISTTGTISTYFNESYIRRSLQCSSGSDFGDPRSRKSSSESDRGIKCSRKFSFDSDSTEHCFGEPLFECSDEASPGCRSSSDDIINDRRDSGVSFNCRHNSVCFRDGAMRLQDSARRHLACSSGFYEPKPGSQQDLYEEPVIYEHIYAEVSS